MGKDKRHINIQKQVHREALKKAGRVHLPPNKVEAPRRAYKKPKYRKIDFDDE